MTYLNSRLAAAACTCAVFVPAICLAQSANYSHLVSSAGGPAPAHIYSIDVNNDGVADIVQDVANSGSAFTVSISNGDGTFKAPVTYSVSSTGANPVPIVPGDFNQDGKVDLAVTIPDTDDVAVYFGNGDGTFQAPKTTTVSLEPSTVFGATPIVMADFNHDGKMDLAVAAHDGVYWSIYVLYGDGAGSFTNPTVIYRPTSGWAVQNVLTGDFDIDNNADVAISDITMCSGTATICSTNVLALYNNGNGTFDALNVMNPGGAMSVSAGDINSDGSTDLFGIMYGYSTNQIATFLGRANRRFSYYFQNYSGSVSEIVNQPLAMADVNIDGNMDLVGLISSGGSLEPVYFLGEGPGNYTVQYGDALPFAAYNIGAAAGHFYGVGQYPDYVISQSSSSSSGTSTLLASLAPYNPTQQLGIGDSGGLCAYPTYSEGISLCTPATQTTSGFMQVEASANSFGQMRKMELWVDGTKIGEEHNVWAHNAWMDLYLNAAAGTHNGTIFAVDVGNTLQRYDFTFNVGSTCGPPPQGKLGVNICTPIWNGNYTNPVPVVATAKITGTLARMEVWVNGTKEYTETTSTSLNTSITMNSGYGQVTVYAVNTAGDKWVTSVYTNVEY